MRWEEVRKAHPNQWLVIEALEARTAGQRRIFDRIAVVESCPDGATTMKRYRELHRAHPQRELCFVHTANAELDIVEESWAGVRLNDAPDSCAGADGALKPVTRSFGSRRATIRLLHDESPRGVPLLAQSTARQPQRDRDARNCTLMHGIEA